MRRALLFAAAVAAWAGTSSPLPRAAQGTAVTIHVAVERPDPVPAGSSDAIDRGGITTKSAAPWRLETGLTREDFEILGDSVPLPVAACAPVEPPVSIVLIADVSASMEWSARSAWLLEPVERSFIPSLDHGDHVMIGRVGGLGLRFSSGSTGSAAELISAARDLLQPTTRDRDHPFGIEGGSPVWDAVDLAVTALESMPGRRGVLLLSDGRATANVHSLADVITHALRSGVSVHVAGSARDETIRLAGATAVRIRPRGFLERLASETGGAYINVMVSDTRYTRIPWVTDHAATRRSLGSALARLVEELHGGYALTFSPPVDDGLMHALDVRVKRAGVTVRAPLSYRAAPAARSR